MPTICDIESVFPSSAIRFVPETHAYFIGPPLRQLQSVTTIIKSLVPEFDRERISARSAAKKGVSQAEILVEWDLKRQYGLEKGTRVHSYVDDVLSGTHDSVLAAVNTKLPEMAAFDDAWGKLRRALHATVLAKEKIIWHEQLGVAGRLDILLEVDASGGNASRIACLFDWKTGEFRVSNKYERLLPPFDDFDSCELNVYSLQTSLYRLILESRGVQICNSYLVHLSDSGTFHLHRGIDLRERVRKWLEANGKS